MFRDRLKFALALGLAVLFAAPLIALALTVQDLRRPGPLRDPRRIAHQAMAIENLVRRVHPDARNLQTLRVRTPHETAVVTTFDDRRAKFLLLDDGAIFPADDEAREVFRLTGKTP